ncbi:hypothetical protein MW887_005940 [Aspergillus wentii]|nr:hypothetical protein MW887_005940 [Aspergillus wentii]
MSADHLLCQINNPHHRNEWFDFDNSFEFSSAYLDSDPNSVNAISPKDYDLTCNGTDGLDWNQSSDLYTQSLFSEFINEEPPLGDCVGNAFDSVGPIADANYMFDQTAAPKQQSFAKSNSTSPEISELEQSIHFPSSFREMVEAQAAVDHRCASKKEKRREAAIAIHMQRLHDAPSQDLDLSSDSNTSFSSPSWSDFMQESVSPASARVSPTMTPPSSDSTEATSTPALSGTSPGNGMELVLDLNLNATTEFPKKQKPRSQAQKDNYIKARKYGACEKHKKQHKRCNCLEKNIARLNVNEAAILATPSVSGLPRQPIIHGNGLRSKQSILPPRESPSTPYNSQTQAQAVVDRNRVDRHTCHNTVLPYPHGTVDRLTCHNTVLPYPHGTVPLERNFARPVTNSAVPGNMEQFRVKVLPQNRNTRPFAGVDRFKWGPGTVQMQSTNQLQSLPGCLEISPTQGHVPRSVYTVPKVHGPGGPRISRSSTAPEDLRPLEGPSAKPQQKSVAKASTSSSSGLFPITTNGVFSSIRSAGGAIQQTVLSFASVWQNYTNLTSWVGAYVGRAVVRSCKQSLSIKKGLELY